jgi:hypothetical protein
MAILIFTPNGKYTTKATLAAAVADADVVGKRIVVTSSITINDITIPATMEFEITNKAVITVNSGKTLTINAPFKPPNYTWYAGAGTVTVAPTNQTITGNITVTGKTTAAEGWFTSLLVSGESNLSNTVILSQITAGITTAKGIMVLKTGDYSGLCLVNGIDSTVSHAFFDLVVCSSVFDVAAVVSSSTLYGTPAARTYSFYGNDLKLAMASGTYGTNVTVIETPRVY